MKSLSRVQLFATPWTVAHQAPLSMGFPRQEYWSGVPLPSPGDLPNPGIEHRSPALRADASPFEPPGKTTHVCILSRFSCVRLFVTPWTAAHQAPLSTEFSRQEYWSAMPFPSPTRSIQALKYWDIFRMNCPKQIFLILFCVELFF